MIIVAKKKTVFIVFLIIVLAAAGIGVGVTAHAVSSPVSRPVIVIDAGHGGYDNGVVAKNGLTEQDFNLSVTRLLKGELQKAGFKVVLTRKNKDGLYDKNAENLKKSDMLKRKEIIQKSNCNMVISIHANKFPDTARRGAQVFFDGSSSDGRLLAGSIQETLNVLNGANVGREFAEQAGDYFMLKCAPVPSVIVECGFLSNLEDAELLCTEAYQKELARVICAGILEYFSL